MATSVSRKKSTGKKSRCGRKPGVPNRVDAPVQLELEFTQNILAVLDDVTRIDNLMQIEDAFRRAILLDRIQRSAFRMKNKIVEQLQRYSKEQAA